MRCQKISDKTGEMIGIRSVSDDEDLLIISSDGVLIRMKVAEIPTYGRSSSGVRVMRLSEGLCVVNIASVPVAADEEPETEEAEEDGTKEVEQNNE